MGTKKLRLFLFEKSGASLRQSTEKPAKNIAIIIGAEGGFSDEEAAFAENSGCTIIGLGARILRCETAPLAVLASLMTLTGNLE